MRCPFIFEFKTVNFSARFNTLMYSLISLSLSCFVCLCVEIFSLELGVFIFATIFGLCHLGKYCVDIS